MAKVDITLLKKLRAMTSAPLKDCKAALLEAGDNLDKAQEVLRKKGALKAAKKADRETNEWVVRVKYDNWTIVAVKLACETDFVAKNEQFIAFADKILDSLLSFNREITNLSELSKDEKKQLDDIIADTVAVVGENVKIVDVLEKKVEQAYVYEHPGSKIVWVVVYKSNNEKAEDAAKEIALQAVAMNPTYTKVEDIPEDERNKYAEEFKAEVIASGKPADIADKIVQGKLNKLYSELVLLEQPWIRDDSKKLKSIVPADFELLEVIRYAI